jgi:hypothetical protein
VIDFPRILEIVHATGPAVTLGIEIAAQATRTIPFLSREWWESFPARSATELIAPLQLLWSLAKSRREPYSSLWEQGADSTTVCADEWRTVVDSATYFASLARVQH